MNPKQPRFLRSLNCTLAQLPSPQAKNAFRLNCKAPLRFQLSIRNITTCRSCYSAAVSPLPNDLLAPTQSYAHNLPSPPTPPINTSTAIDDAIEHPLLTLLTTMLTKEHLIPLVPILDSIRQHHPNSVVVSTRAGGTDLISYADDGEAHYVQDQTFPSYGNRSFADPKSCEKERDSGIRINTLLGRHIYTWHNQLNGQKHRWLVYKVDWTYGDWEGDSLEVIVAPIPSRLPSSLPLPSQATPSSRSNDNIEALQKHQLQQAREQTEKEVDALIEAATRHKERVDPSSDIWLFDRGYWRKSTKLGKNVKSASWETVILDVTIKDRVRSDVEGFFDHEAAYKGFGVPWKRGIIFHGMPGNGKTITIKALMHSLASRSPAIPTLYVKGMGQKGDADAIRSIFEKARESKPCLLVFEDLDSLVGDSVRSFFLNEVDGLEGNDGIMMIGSTNHLDKLDAGISKRPSRFDRKYHFGLPARGERVLYASFWVEKIKKDGNADLPERFAENVADVTQGFSFAYMQEVFVSALLEVVRTSETAKATSEDTAGVAGLFDRGKGKLEGNLIWQAIDRQVRHLRKEIQDSKRSVEDAGRNSVATENQSGDGRGTGFGLGR